MQARLGTGYNGGNINVPPSKSMAHRVLICAALAHGQSRVSGIIASADMYATMRAMRALGAEIHYNETTCTALVTGIASEDGSINFNAVTAPVDCGESGSTLRFLIPLFSLTGAPVRFICHGKLAQRPQSVYEKIFKNFDNAFENTDNGLYINGKIKCGEYVVDGSVSSQFISGLLFALPLLDNDSTIKITPPFESKSYVDLTVAAMRDMGVIIEWANEYTISVKGKQYYKKLNSEVEGDSSQAAFWAVLAACSGIKGSKIELHGLRSNSLQGDDVIFDILKNCGAEVVDTRAENGVVTVYESRDNLNGTEIDLANCPDLGPILTILGLFCKGKTHIKNAARLRIKESDRIYAMECEIKKLGGKISSDDDNIYIEYSKNLALSAEFSSHGDHRIVMAMSVAALCVSSKNSENTCNFTINNAQDVNKSYPDFFTHLKTLGVNVELADT